MVQGSVLGPLLFLLYINDVADIFNSDVKIKLYADDLKLYSSVQTNDDCNNLQNNINFLCEWANVWQLTISKSKCFMTQIGIHNGCYSYSLCNSPITTRSEISDLGVIVDSNLNFTSHINSIVSKAHVRANLILRSFQSKRDQSLIKAFNTYVRPLLEYCSSVWSPLFKKDIIKIESVQRRFTKRLPGYKHLTYPQRLRKLNMESLEVRRIRNDLLLAYKIVFGILNTDLNHYFKIKEATYNLKGHKYKLQLPMCKNSRSSHFYFYRVISVWNNLPALTTDFSSLGRFKNSLTVQYILQYCVVNIC